MRLYKILLKPIITEKVANMGLVANRYAFQVSQDATKIDIKKAVSELYGVEVASVNVVSTREKFKYGRKRGMQLRKRAAKKAYITLKDANATIDFTMVK